MQQIRSSSDRGITDLGWLVSRHTFSFAEYEDPKNVQFGVLRVINEDRVAPGGGFSTHRHKDMEIISYVLSGQLSHHDSMGNGSIIRRGDVQRMSAGTGVAHSEANASQSEPVHFLQIWIIPDKIGIQPGYEQKHFDATSKRGRLQLIISRDGVQGSVRIQQDVRVYAGLLDGAESASLQVEADRRIYVHVVQGVVTVNDVGLSGGDALKITNMRNVEVGGAKSAEVLVFDLPGDVT